MAIVEIQLTLGKIAIIDAADYTIAAKYKWHATLRDNKWYAASSSIRKAGKCLYLHREIMAAPGQRISGSVTKRSLLETMPLKKKRPEHTTQRQLSITVTSQD